MSKLSDLKALKNPQQRISQNDNVEDNQGTEVNHDNQYSSESNDVQSVPLRKTNNPLKGLQYGYVYDPNYQEPKSSIKKTIGVESTTLKPSEEETQKNEAEVRNNQGLLDDGLKYDMSYQHLFDKDEEEELYDQMMIWKFLKPERSGKEIVAIIDYTLLKQYLVAHGFYYLELNREELIVRVIDNQVEKVNEKYLIDYIYKKAPTKLHKHLVVRNNNQIFGSNVLRHMHKLEIEFHKPSEGKQRVFFLNGYIDVDHQKIGELQPYRNLDCVVWKDAIIQRNYRPHGVIKTATKSEYVRFLINTMNNHKPRVKALVSAIGYCLYDYYQASQTKAIIFVDEKMAENDEDANGRTGKSLVARSLRQFNKFYLEIDSRNLKFASSFTFQEADHNTKIIHFDDAQPKFEFDKLFSAISENLTVEKKNRQPFKIKNVKFLISTNHVIRSYGDSYDARMFEVEFSEHYSKINSPKNEFGHELFSDDWDLIQWEYFDNFCLNAIRYYLRYGLQDYAKINLGAKKSRAGIPPIFYEFIEEIEGCIQSYTKNELYYKYVELYNKVARLSLNKFTRLLRKYFQLRGLAIEFESTTGNVDKKIVVYEPNKPKVILGSRGKLSDLKPPRKKA